MVVALVLVVVFKGRQKTSNGNYIIVICYIHIFSFFLQISENDDLTAASNEAIYGILNTEPAYEVISD